MEQTEGVRSGDGATAVSLKAVRRRQDSNSTKALDRLLLDRDSSIAAPLVADGKVRTGNASHTEKGSGGGDDAANVFLESAVYLSDPSWP